MTAQPVLIPEGSAVERALVERLVTRRVPDPDDRTRVLGALGLTDLPRSEGLAPCGHPWEQMTRNRTSGRPECGGCRRDQRARSEGR